MWDEPNGELRCRNARSFRPHERCWFIQTAGRWPWKSEAAKECVTTHLPNEAALKMDGAEACYPYSAFPFTLVRGRVGGRGGRCEAQAVMLGEAASSADLGGSSKYSSGNLED
jgi:hypothetical protein